MKTNWIAGALLGLLVCGCGDDKQLPNYKDDLVPVTGTITVDGEKLAGVAVTFMPSSAPQPGQIIPDSNTQIGYGVTDAQGKYTLLSPPSGPEIVAEEYVGALPGIYLISFSRMLMDDGSVWDPKTSELGPMAVDAKETIPSRLASPNTSGITATVKDGQNEPIDFDIKTK